MLKTRPSQDPKSNAQGLKLAELVKIAQSKIIFSIFNFFINRAQIVSIRIAQSEEALHASSLVNIK